MGKPPEFGLKAPRRQIYWVRSAATPPNEFKMRRGAAIRFFQLLRRCLGKLLGAAVAPGLSFKAV